MLSDWNKILREVDWKTPFLKSERIRRSGIIIYPRKEQVFRALHLTKPQNIKVVIIGQDPYFNKNQANGLSFSVNSGNKIPPSLRNIFKEMKNDLKIERTNTDLVDLAQQGVLLLNSILTVEESKPGSHKDLGWQLVTDHLIKSISYNKNIVFMLWGKYAQEKEQYIDSINNLILKAAHPSPYSANKFFGCKHFSKCNEYLIYNHKSAIIWG